MGARNGPIGVLGANCKRFGVGGHRAEMTHSGALAEELLNGLVSYRYLLLRECTSSLR